MTLSIRVSDLHIIDDGDDLGHVVDAARNDPSVAASAKAALDVAWLAREEQHRDALRAADAAGYARAQAEKE